MSEKHSDLEWAFNPFWYGFMKQAVVKIPKFLSKIPTTTPKLPKVTETGAVPLGVPRMTRMTEGPVKTIKPATGPLDYAKMNEISRKPAGTMNYDAKGVKSYTPPQAPPFNPATT